MRQDELPVGAVIRVNCTINPFIRWWKGRVVDPPREGLVKVQRVSMIDGKDFDREHVVSTRDCSLDTGSAYFDDERVAEEKFEREHAPLRDKIIAALKAKGIPFGQSRHGPEIEFAPGDGLKWLALALGVEGTGLGGDL